MAVGVIRTDGNNCEILSNIRKTYTAPTGEGFLNREVTVHHRNNIVALVLTAMSEARVSKDDISVICYTKGISWKF